MQFPNSLAFDVETLGDEPEYGLQPWRAQDNQAIIRTFATSQVINNEWVNKGYKFFDRYKFSQFLQHCAENDISIVTWSGTFDIAWLLAYGLREEVFACKWLDAMLLWKRHQTRLPNYKLKTAVSIFLPHLAGYENGIDFAGDIDELVGYNKIDSFATAWLAYYFWSKLTEAEQVGALVEMADLAWIADANMRGLPVNPLSIGKLKGELEEQDAKGRAKLAGHLPPGLNVGSPTQVANLLYNTWGYPIKKRTEKGKPSADKDVLTALALDDDRCRQIINVREAKNRMNKYVKTPLTSLTYHQRDLTFSQKYGTKTFAPMFLVRPQCIKGGTYTGRCTYGSKQGEGVNTIHTGTALHQWKRGKKFRQMYIAPPGYKLVEWDFSGQENRWMAELSGDPTMRHIFQNKMDIHSYMGSRVTGFTYNQIVNGMAKGDRDLEYQKTEEYEQLHQARYVGKFDNLSLQYRTSALKLRTKGLTDYGMVFTLDQTTFQRNTYLQTFAGVPLYWMEQIAKGRRDGYVQTVGGRRVYFAADAWNRHNRWSSESTTINFPIQGVGGDQKALAMAVLCPNLHEIGGLFAWDLHDGLFAFLLEETAIKEAKKIKYLLSNLPYEQVWGYKPTVKFPVDCKIGDNWGDMVAV